MKTKKLPVSKLNQSTKEINNNQAVKIQQREPGLIEKKQPKNHDYIDALIQKIKQEFHNHWVTCWQNQKPNTFQLIYDVVLFKILFAIFFCMLPIMMGSKEYLYYGRYFGIFCVSVWALGVFLGLFFLNKRMNKKIRFTIVVLSIICNGNTLSVFITKYFERCQSEFYVFIPIVFFIITMFFKGFAFLYDKFRYRDLTFMFLISYVLIFSGSASFASQYMKNQSDFQVLKQLAVLIIFFFMGTIPAAAVLLNNNKDEELNILKQIQKKQS